MTIHPDLIAL